MKRQVFYIHGGETFDTHNHFIAHLTHKEIRDLPGAESFVKWTKTLPEELGPQYEVFMPAMPNKENAQYEEWKIWFERHFEYLHDDLILIGYSLGAMFFTRYLTENTTPFSVTAVILMAGAVEDTPTEECGDFRFSLEEVDVIKDRAAQVIIMHSKDDFLVPFSHGERLHAAIPGSEFVVCEDKNHFLIEEFPELVERIKGLG